MTSTHSININRSNTINRAKKRYARRYRGVGRVKQIFNKLKLKISFGLARIVVGLMRFLFLNQEYYAFNVLKKHEINLKINEK